MNLIKLYHKCTKNYKGDTNMNISVNNLKKVKHVPFYLKSLKDWNNTLVDSKDIKEFNSKIENEKETKKWN